MKERRYLTHYPRTAKAVQKSLTRKNKQKQLNYIVGGIFRFRIELRRQIELFLNVESIPISTYCVRYLN